MVTVGSSVVGLARTTACARVTNLSFGTVDVAATRLAVRVAVVASAAAVGVGVVGDVC